MNKFSKLGAFERRIAVLCFFLFTAFLVLFSRLPGWTAAMEKQRKWEGEFYEFSALFSEIYGDIKDRYVEDIDSKKLFEGAIRGMFTSLDPHSQWLSPDSLQQLEKDTEGEFSGVGLHITLKDNVLTVIAPIPGSPAAKAGMLPMDRIVEIDGKSTENITLVEAVKKLTGVTGSEVKVKVFREGETDYMEFSLVRDTIKVDSVYSRVLHDDIAYLRIVRFADDTAEDVKKALKEFKKQPKLKGIVVDLRYDTGGLLDKAVQICSFFLPDKQLVVSTKGRKPDSNKTFRAEGDPICNLPMVVLVNKGSASASEIFAGAMQDTKRGMIVGPKGEKTFGKGSVQTISYLKHSLERNDTGEPQLSGMRLTTAKYYTPSGRTIHEIGISPDFEVPLTKEEVRALAIHGLIGDPDQTGIVPDEEKNKEKSKDDKDKDASKDSEPAKDKAPKEFHDTQLEKGIEYLSLDSDSAGRSLEVITSMPRAVVTGAAGFLGSHLSDRLVAEGFDVVAIDNLVTGSTANIDHIRSERFAFIKQDVTEYLYIRGPVDFVLHFASPASPVDYLAMPIQTLKVGALGTHKTLGLAREKKARFLLASTSEVYGDPEVHPQPENYWGNVNPIGPRGVYDEAKRFAEAMTMAYQRYHGMETRIARIFNTYGPRMRLEDGRVVPNFIAQALRNEPLTVYGTGEQTRSFCYVSDLVDGIFRLLMSGETDPVNIGTEFEMSIIDFAKLIIKLSGSSSKIVHQELPVDDPKTRRPYISKARSRLGWEPKVGLEEGLRKSIDFFRQKTT